MDILEEEAGHKRKQGPIFRRPSTIGGRAQEEAGHKRRQGTRGGRAQEEAGHKRWQRTR
jgi:hypothetical protein